MLNEIILNGESSLGIKGLIIQTLPPISKPQIRTSVEEIDGRDGDIVTKLGYSSYEKSFNIGLSYNYDIDEIISFFNSEGTVIFSNEEDKYYNYQIFQQIDFEKLIRFKTATVNMHVQPFKYSVIETGKTFYINNQLLSFNNYTKTTNGITVTASDGVINISGTGTAATEFYMPINLLTLNPGSYTLNAYSSGTGANACSIRLINDSPSNVNSFGGGYVTLQSDSTESINASLDTKKSYNYVYFYIVSNVAMNFTLNLQVQNNGEDSFSIKNSGNYLSRPVMSIYGSGTINLSLNGDQIFVIQLGEDDYITIDTNNMEASKDGLLKNRSVTGDYDNFALNPGQNTISYTGNITQISFTNYSRWL